MQIKANESAPNESQATVNNFNFPNEDADCDAILEVRTHNKIVRIPIKQNQHSVQVIPLNPAAEQNRSIPAQQVQSPENNIKCMKELGIPIPPKKMEKLMLRFGNDQDAIIAFIQKKIEKKENKRNYKKQRREGRQESKLEQKERKFMQFSERLRTNPNNDTLSPKFVELKKQYPEQLDLINQRGYRNDKLNLKLLRKFNGDAVAVLNWLQSKEININAKMENLMLKSAEGILPPQSGVTVTPMVVFPESQ